MNNKRSCNINRNDSSSSRLELAEHLRCNESEIPTDISEAPILGDGDIIIHDNNYNAEISHGKSVFDVT